MSKRAIIMVPLNDDCPEDCQYFKIHQTDKWADNENGEKRLIRYFCCEHEDLCQDMDDFKKKANVLAIMKMGEDTGNKFIKDTAHYLRDFHWDKKEV